jgi:hypothetical protein
MLEDFELQFNVSIYDWFFMMTEEGYASTIILIYLNNQKPNFSLKVISSGGTPCFLSVFILTNNFYVKRLK